MPDLLPEYDRAIYLDADTVLLHDIAELFHSPSSGFAAVAPDITMHAYNNSPQATEEYLGEYGNIPTYWKQYLQLTKKAQETYFNSGVMVLNLKKIRQASLPSVIMDVLHSKPFIFVDQDILNIVFDGDVQPISLQWNFFSTLNPELRYPEPLLAQRENAAKNIYLLHYAGKQPWRTAGMVPYENYFWFYARQSLQYETLRAQKLAAQHARCLPARLKKRITTSPPLMLFKKRFPGVYNALRSGWRRLHA